MRQHTVKKIIFSSTAAVYGNQSNGPVLESTPTIPTSTYGMTKLAIDMAIASYCTAYDFAAISFRYFNVAGAYSGFGERHPDESHIIPIALSVAAGKQSNFSIFGDDYPTPDGTCIRDYIHVADLADAHILGLEHLRSGEHSIYNLGNGNGFSNRQVIETIEKITHKSIPLRVVARREGDPAILVADSTKAKRGLHWSPQKTSLEDIISDAWNFYQQQ